MAFKFNPVTGKLDLVGSGAGPAIQSANYEKLFNATTDWTGPASGFYSIITPAAVHLKGIKPIVQVYELVGSEYELITAAVSVNATTGEIIIGVVDIPDSRFEGKLIVSENN